MKKYIRYIVIIGAIAFMVLISPLIVLAWGPNRETYSLEKINDPATLNGKVTFNSIVIADSDYAWYKKQKGEDLPTGMIKDERNFVGARECIYDASTATQCKTDGVNNSWHGNDITVEDGKTYLVRLYVHNNSITTAAKDVHTKFFLPQGYKAEQTIDGQISSSNSMYAKYWDYVDFKSADGTPFKIEYVEGSALLENKVFTSAKGGKKLGDEIVSGTDGVMIGYDSMNGVIPGCYDYDAYINIKVKVIYEPEFTTETLVRLADNEDKTWQTTINAKVGDIVEFQIEYNNTDKDWQCGVAIKDILPQNLHYVAGSTILYNSSHPTGLIMNDNSLVTTGFGIGSYNIDSNAIVRFRAEVIDENLAEGSNTLVNWGQAGVADITRQDYARVVIYKNVTTKIKIVILSILFIFCLIMLVALQCKLKRLRKDQK